MRFAVAMFFVLLVISAAHAATIDSRVMDELNPDDSISVIVTLKNTPTIQTGKFRAAQSVSVSDVVSSLGADKFEKKREFKSFKGFSGNITKKGLEKLLSDPRVASIETNERVHAFLAESAPLINATRTWQVISNGVNVTGAGETVCVIDTGVNYNHSALGSGWGNIVVGGYRFLNASSDQQDCSLNNSACYDDFGHGTHVAGIIASNDSTNRGIAPSAKIVVIKALDSSGSGYTEDITAGIDWCVSNAAQYNITIISMSLGTDTTYSTYCDTNYNSSFRPSINAAVNANISVIAASGNAGNTTGISAPGCIQNATSVGATYDANIGGVGFSVCSDVTTAADKITCYTNRNSLLDLLAPGSSITSANYSGGFVAEHGTSMATPMVSGAFALAHQYKKLDARVNLTPLQIENSLKATGKNVTDSMTNLTFPRINIFAAIKNLDTTPPLVTLQNPGNATYNTTNITLNYSVYDSIGIDRCWFVNTTGQSIFLNVQSGAACTNTTFFAGNVLNNITVYANDTAGNTNFSFVSFTVKSISISIQIPANGSIFNFNISIPLNFTIQNISAVDKIWYNIDNSNNTVITGNSTFNTSESSHNITVFANTTSGLLASSSSSFTIDFINPSVFFVAPTPLNVTLNTTNDFMINVTLSKTGNVLLESNFNGTFNNRTMAGNGTLFNYSFTDIADGNYTFRVFANDTAGNANVTGPYWVYVNATRNVSSFIATLAANLSAGNVTVTLLNTTGSGNNASVFLDVNYTLRFNATGVIADIANFSWLNTDLSNIVNVTRNVTIENVSAAFSANGGVVDKYVWVDVNNFTNSYAAVVSFNGAFRLNYYINGSRTAPDSTQITNNCAIEPTRPCYSVQNGITTLYLLSFSGAVAGNDTQAPSLTVTSPSGAYSTNNITISCTATDNVAIDKYWYVLNGGANTSINGCGATLLASAGTNTFTLYINDTTGNINSSSTSFTYTVPVQQQASSSGGGGGGGGLPTANVVATQKLQSWDTISGALNINVGIDSIPARAISVDVDGAASSVSVKVAAEQTPPVVISKAYQYFSVSFTNLPANKIKSAEILFAVNKSWVKSNGYDPNRTYLARFANGWDKLTTLLVSENSTHYIYRAATPGFSYFAVVGENAPIVQPPAAVTNTTQPQEKLCAQVITPATKDGQCIYYQTPCDVPEGWKVVRECPKAGTPVNEETVNDILIFFSFIAGLFIVHRLVYKKRKKKEKHAYTKKAIHEAIKDEKRDELRRNHIYKINKRR